jgi:hypothetical protein
VPADHQGLMWDLTIPGNDDHDFYVVVQTRAGSALIPAYVALIPASVALLVHNGTNGTAGEVWRDAPYRFVIYSNDHGPPHGHSPRPRDNG